MTAESGQHEGLVECLLRHRAGADRDRAGVGGRGGLGWPAASAAECRPGEEMVGPSPVEAAQLPPASHGTNSGPSRLPWVLAACFRLPRKPCGSWRHAAVPAASRGSSGQPISRGIARWATSTNVRYIIES